ncbi:hypothetical protein HDU88_002529 [Geranomyces variabilis]|nr:hypothetical protein HDU88_002529 [Geranomyces variabilis]
MTDTSLPNVRLDLLNTLPRLDSESPIVRPFIAVVWDALARFGWAAALEAEITLVRNACVAGNDDDDHDQDLATATLTNIFCDLDRELQRFHSCTGTTPFSSPSITPVSSPAGSPRSGRFRPLEGKTASMAIFPASPWCFKKSAAPRDRSAAFRAQIEERDQYQCVVTGEFSRPIHPDQGHGPCEAAHIFPFALAAYVPRLSRLIYPPEIFQFMRSGANIDSLTNGVLLQRGVHNFSFEHDGTTYRAYNPGKTRFVTDQTTISFNDPAPHPTLINFHACMGHIRRNLTLLGLWKAAGERTDLFDDDDPNMRPVRPSSAATLGQELVSPSKPGLVAFDIPPLVL